MAEVMFTKLRYCTQPQATWCSDQGRSHLFQYPAAVDLRAAGEVMRNAGAAGVLDAECARQGFNIQFETPEIVGEHDRAIVTQATPAGFQQGGVVALHVEIARAFG